MTNTMDLNITGLHDSEVGEIAEKVRALPDSVLVQLGAKALMGIGAPSAPVMPAPVTTEKPKRGRKPKADKPAPKKGAKANPVKATGKPRASRVKADSPEVSSAADQIVEQLEAHASEGQTAEAARAALGMDKKLFVKAVNLLKETGRIKITGQKRATRYFPKG